MSDPARPPSERPSLGRRLGMVAWGALPALLMTASAPFGGADIHGSPEPIGNALLWIAFLGGPFILYAWSAVVVRRSGSKYWVLSAIPVAIGMCVTNIVLGFGGCGIVGGLL